MYHPSQPLHGPRCTNCQPPSPRGSLYRPLPSVAIVPVDPLLCNVCADLSSFGKFSCSLIPFCSILVVGECTALCRLHVVRFILSYSALFRFAGIPKIRWNAMAKKVSRTRRVLHIHFHHPLALFIEVHALVHLVSHRCASLSSTYHRRTYLCIHRFMYC